MQRLLETESFISMNHSEEASLSESSTAPLPSISRHVMEDLVLINTSDNAPQSLYTTTPAGSGLRLRFATSSGLQHQPRDVITRRRVIQGDSTGAEQLRQFQIETETTENEVQAERTANAQLQVAQLATEMAELQARTSIAEEALASSRQLLHVLHRQSAPPPTTPTSLSPHSSHSSPLVLSP